MRRRSLVISVVVIVLVATGITVIAVYPPKKSITRQDDDSTTIPRDVVRVSTSAPATFVGRESCIPCHEEQNELWTGSHHDLAMQVATEDTVLGDFDNASLEQFGVTSRFYSRDDSFFVETDGPDGTMQEYEVTYTFGVTPLQQYLVEFPRGRKQVLPLCWDTRPESDGGQRWFHIYPDEEIDSTDELHWTGPLQNWNFMCAECHSTNLQRNYTLEDDSYQTNWSEINVSCEACHGPGSRHIEWANGQQRTTRSVPSDPAMGLLVQLKDHDDGAWLINMNTGSSARTVSRESHAQVETCGRCHARRGPINPSYEHGALMSDQYRVARLDERLYYPDGQILDEVYVYGSFVQSKMYHAGVTCSDCHDAHTLKLRVPGNAVCFQCHIATKYNTPDHHFHDPAGAGSECVGCHMPTRKYMVVDPRLDHSIRIPRPDLSETLGTPNACNECHRDESAAWAANAIREHFGEQSKPPWHFGEAIVLGRSGHPGAEDALIRLANDGAQPAIARATAYSLLSEFPSAETFEAIREGLQDTDPMVRTASLEALEFASPRDRLVVAFDLLDDPVRIVRITAARMLAPVMRESLSTDQRAVLEKAIDELIESDLAAADRAESHINLGNLYVQLDRPEDAESSYRTAMRLAPNRPEAYVNLADFFRAMDKDVEGERVLRTALERAPENAAIHHALGLVLVRLNRTDTALDSLKAAVRFDSSNPRYAYVYAVALDSADRTEDAIRVLESAHRNHPSDRAILSALVTYFAQQNNLDSALLYARRLLEQIPDDPAIQQWVEELEDARGR